MPKNILVIDDDGLVTKSVCGLLQNNGFTTDDSENGPDAIELVKDTHIDLIVADIRLPGMNGVEAVKQIKELLKAKHKMDVPVIFITGFSDPDVNAEAQKLGRLIYKPFDNTNFLDIINSAVETET